MVSIVPLVLRAGLGIFWLFDGMGPILTALLWGSHRFARPVLSASFGEPWLWLAGATLEAAMGAALLVGYRVRTVAALQVIYLGGLMLWLLGAFIDVFPDGNRAWINALPPFGAASVLLCLGGGQVQCWDVRRDRRQSASALARADSVGRLTSSWASSMYETQSMAVHDPELAALLFQWSGEDRSLGEPISRVQALFLRAGVPAARLLGWTIAASGVRPLLRSDLELEERRCDLSRRRIELATRLELPQDRDLARHDLARGIERIDRFRQQLAALGEGVV